jgi:hypothetical protein
MKTLPVLVGVAAVLSAAEAASAAYVPRLFADHGRTRTTRAAGRGGFLLFVPLARTTTFTASVTVPVPGRHRDGLPALRERERGRRPGLEQTRRVSPPRAKRKR